MCCDNGIVTVGSEIFGESLTSKLQAHCPQRGAETQIEL